MLKFLDGEVDSIFVRGKEYPLIKPQEKKGNFTVYDLGPGPGSSFIFFNQNAGINPKTKKPFVDPIKSQWFRDVSFRKAVAHAVDKAKMIEILIKIFDETDMQKIGNLVKDLKQTGMIVGNNIKFKGEVY